MPGKIHNALGGARWMSTVVHAGAILLTFCWCVEGSLIPCQAQKSEDAEMVVASYEQQLANQRYPELVYWFVAPETLSPQHYRKDIEHIAKQTEFTFPFLTGRRGVDLLNNPAAHKAVAGIVRDAHLHNLKIGMTFVLGARDGSGKTAPDDAQTIVSEGQTTLNEMGRGALRFSVRLRSEPFVKTELLRAYAFRKTAEGEYDPSTLVDVTSRVGWTAPSAGKVAITVDLGHRFGGYTVFAMANNWTNVLDLFSHAYRRWVRDAIDQYRDIPLDGTALDEFKYYTLLPPDMSTQWTGRIAGEAFSRSFRATTGMELTRVLFDARYAPQGHPEVRIRAIDRYWDFLRQGPLQIEQEFYRYSRQVFGDTTFAGIHDTFHNHLTNDEAWATGLNWWTIPRQYGMSDEDLSLPMRMGLLVAHPGNIMYDQYYGWDIHRFAKKALNDARFDARIHYHGYNDTGHWGVDLSSAPFLAQMNPIEQKIRLLNHFDPAAPRLPLLVIFGMPALLDWYPDESVRNDYDLNGALHIEEKVKEIWDAGYRCAVVPSDLIDNGALRLDARNRPVLNGHVFQAVIYLYPQYAKRSSLAFLDRYTRNGGALMLEGSADRDFDGAPVNRMFAGIEARARVKHFSVEGIAELGVKKSPLRDTGGELEDGSVILTDLGSLETGHPKPFSVEVSGHQFSGAYIGVLALKAANDGQIIKLACGECSSLSRDGKRVLHLARPADLLLTHEQDGAYQALLIGEQGGNQIHLSR